MLLLGLEVIEDIRRKIRDLRDSLFSSGLEAASLADRERLSSNLEREEMEDPLSSRRIIVMIESRFEPAEDDIDLLRSSGLLMARVDVGDGVSG
jgi:hypothetical protein